MKKRKNNKTNFYEWFIHFFFFFCSHRTCNEVINPIWVGIDPLSSLEERSLKRKEYEKHERSFPPSKKIFTDSSRQLNSQHQCKWFLWGPARASWFGLRDLVKKCNSLLANLLNNKSVFWIVDWKTMQKRVWKSVLFCSFFFFLLQGFVWLYVIEIGRFNDAWRAYIALHSGIETGHWFEPKQTKQVKTMNHNWKSKLRKEFMFF